MLGVEPPAGFVADAVETGARGAVTEGGGRLALVVAEGCDDTGATGCLARLGASCSAVFEFASTLGTEKALSDLVAWTWASELSR